MGVRFNCVVIFDGRQHSMCNCNLGKHLCSVFSLSSSGVAYISTICESTWGYGVSAGVQGSMSDLGGAMFW